MGALRSPADPATAATHFREVNARSRPLDVVIRRIDIPSQGYQGGGGSLKRGWKEGPTVPGEWGWGRTWISGRLRTSTKNAAVTWRRPPGGGPPGKGGNGGASQGSIEGTSDRPRAGVRRGKGGSRRGPWAADGGVVEEGDDELPDRGVDLRALQHLRHQLRGPGGGGETMNGRGTGGGRTLALLRHNPHLESSRFLSTPSPPPLCPNWCLKCAWGGTARSLRPPHEPPPPRGVSPLDPPGREGGGPHPPPGARRGRGCRCRSGSAPRPPSTASLPAASPGRRRGGRDTMGG